MSDGFRQGGVEVEKGEDGCVLDSRLGEGLEERFEGCSEVCVEAAGPKARDGADVWERGYGP